jgi:uncharacterized protein (DUF2141 family)
MTTTRKTRRAAATFALAGLAAAGTRGGDALAEPSPAPAPSAPAPAAAPARVSLVIEALDFKGSKGRALIAVYDSSDTWLKPPRALKLVTTPITGSKISVTIGDLPPGVYAVSVIHDENTNNKLDMHWFPVPGPDEGAGVSNDATATFGPPSFKDARFRLSDKGGLITLHVRY